jgi:hypothetical protein
MLLRASFTGWVSGADGPLQEVRLNSILPAEYHATSVFTAECMHSGAHYAHVCLQLSQPDREAASLHGFLTLLK